jgi:hypothetical protein
MARQTGLEDGQGPGTELRSPAGHGPYRQLSLRTRSALNSVVRDVDLAGTLVSPGNHQQPAECDVLVDHQAQLGDLRVAERLPQLGLEHRIDRAEVRREPFGQPNR